jgi:hypothetical protein
LFFGYWNYGQAADYEQRRLGEDRLCFDCGEALGCIEALADLDADHGELGISGIHLDYCAGANGGAFVARVVEDPLRSGFHLAEMLHGGWVGYAIPVCLLVAQEVVEGIDIGLGLEEEVGHALHRKGKAGN